MNLPTIPLSGISEHFLQATATPAASLGLRRDRPSAVPRTSSRRPRRLRRRSASGGTGLRPSRARPAGDRDAYGVARPPAGPAFGRPVHGDRLCWAIASAILVHPTPAPPPPESARYARGGRGGSPAPAHRLPGRFSLSLPLYYPSRLALTASHRHVPICHRLNRRRQHAPCQAPP
jgi:hypothetical protein